MRLKTVSLHPFGRFLDETRDLSAPLAIIAGPNEVGKTTLRQAIFHALFTPTKLTPGKLRDIQPWFPLPGGDHAAVTLTFESQGKEWTLRKIWGSGASTRLSAVGAVPLSDPGVVGLKLAEMLGQSEATYNYVLTTAHTELEQTITQLEKNKEVLRDVRDLLRATSGTAGDVDVQKLLDALSKRIEVCFSRWDDQRELPEKHEVRGFDDPWKQKVGEILDAWYQWQYVRIERDEIVELERKIDTQTAILTMLDAKDSKDRSLIATYGVQRSPLLERQALEEKNARLDPKVAELKRVSEAWPGSQATIEKWKTDKPRLDQRTRQLEDEKTYAWKRETQASLPTNYQNLVRAKGEYENAVEVLGKLACPDPAVMKEIDNLAINIVRWEAQISAQSLAWQVAVSEPKTLSIAGGMDPATLLTVSSDGARGSAAGRIELQADGITFVVTSGDQDFDTLRGQLLRGKDRLRELLATLGVETVDSAKQLVNVHTDAQSVVKTAEAKFKGQLGARTFAEWEQEIKDFHELPPTREYAIVEADFMVHTKSVDGQEEDVQNQSQRLKEWQEQYVSLDQLAVTLAKTQEDLDRSEQKLRETPPLPPGFDSATQLSEMLDDAQNRLDANGGKRGVAEEERNRLQREIGDRRSEDLAERAEILERTFRRSLTKGRSLRRIQEVLRQLTAGSDHVMSDFVARIESIFSQVTHAEAKLQFDGSLLAQVRRGDLTVTPKQLSQGANGALALAMRLALAETHLQETGGFIILDDPLVHFDSHRAAEACAIIRDFSQRHQVIFLTCHEDHAAYLQA
jgi:uncharacterized protein YhaN